MACVCIEPWGQVSWPEHHSSGTGAAGVGHEPSHGEVDGNATWPSNAIMLVLVVLSGASVTKYYECRLNSAIRTFLLCARLRCSCLTRERTGLVKPILLRS